MPSSSKAKGSRVERELAAKLTESGFPSTRVPMSGAASRYAGAAYESDVRVSWENADAVVETLTVEVKARKNGAGFAVLEKWMGTSQILALKRNNREFDFFIPWKTMVKLLKGQLKVEIRESKSSE